MRKLRGIFLAFIFLSVSITLNANNISTTNWKLQVLKVFDLIENQYVETNISNEQLVHGSIEGMIKSLDDPYTRFLKPEGFSDLKTNLQGNFFGIGIHIGLKQDKLMVISPMEGTPADKAGLKSFDVITSINAESAFGISLEEAVSKIRGEKGTAVVLGISREGITDNFSVKITRDIIQIKSIKEIKMLTEKIGYIRLMTFESKETYGELKEAINSLKKTGMDKLILDVRYNGGGLLQNALDIAGIFIGSEIVVQTVGRKGDTRALVSNRANVQAFSGPLVVLVNGASASASEILAGAIRDHGRGVVMGTQTFGKASVQEVIPLQDNSAILLTTAKYLTPKGTNINKTGITPDVVVEIPSEDIKLMQEGAYEYSLEKDFQINQAIKYLKKK
ncbi:MAG: S41 family peptidase [Candidatus Margulisbacteria bacterium]|nr:S41 family peptidase [Candidatus Margulisiibacteriota bacterium]